MTRNLYAALLGATILCSPAAFAAEVKIGVVGPLTGPAATSGIAMRDAYQFVADEVNAAGGIDLNGEKTTLKLIFEDSASRPEIGVSAAQKLLTRDNVDLLVGDTFASSVTIALMDVAASYGKFVMSGQPVSSEIARKVESDPKRFANFWKASWNSDAYAKAVFEAVEGLTAAGKFSPEGKKIAFVFEDTDYGKSNTEFAVPLFKEAGWSEVGHEAVPLGHSDFYPQLSKLRGAKPDVLVSIFTSVNSGVALTRQIKETGLDSLHVAIYYPLRPEFHQGVGADSEKMLWTPMLYDPVNNEKHKALFDLMESKGVAATGDHAQGYCQFAMLVDNLKRAGTYEPAKLSEAFAQTDFDCYTGRFVYDTANHTPKIGPEFLPVAVAQV
ncbi:ABC transporter substrate-binding protein [Pseudochelatococcus contaminans]|uniref:ABC-type branched-subunit amino acid transport system substrate-binding protein n=1 Tax=Pseudochelatococcus contaminans TaxID=1538103 RepID=A0A7W6EE49_9HYPH|nr:ABC transporter substrate-binding protein [Pseudochelatococcus contaminans]MBB3808054.1 ABC-type branched-subunit amino acid transport system substrate-binding protein [Pseudochelatococcus contaminans]